MLLHPLGELRRAHQAGLHRDLSESEVVTVCSWQFAGEERLQSTAMILSTTARNPVATMSIDAANRRLTGALSCAC